MEEEKDQPTPKIMTDVYSGGITEMRYFAPHFNRGGMLCYPFGGTMCSRASLAEPDRWYVYRYSAIPGYGWKLIGSNLSMTRAIQLAREMQG
jgi:hypothetical protein